MIISEQRRVHTDQQGLPNKIQVLKTIRKPNTEASQLMLPPSYSLQNQHNQPLSRLGSKPNIKKSNRINVTNKQNKQTTIGIYGFLLILGILVVLIVYHFMSITNKNSIQTIRHQQNHASYSSHRNNPIGDSLWQSYLQHISKEKQLTRLEDYLSWYINQKFQQIETNQTFSESYLHYMKKDIKENLMKDIMDQMACKKYSEGQPESGQFICKFSMQSTNSNAHK